MRTLSAVLYIDDSSTAPVAGLRFEIDGEPVVQRDEVSPAVWMAVVDAQGQATGDDLRSRLGEHLTGLVDQLQAAVAEGRETQQQREQALADWQQVTA
jgi:hypothetical protein